MASGYAKDQPQGFTNRIEKVAIVGVRCLNTFSARSPWHDLAETNHHSSLTSASHTQASGKIGKHLTAALLKTGKHTVTAIARPDSASTFPEGVHVARVEYGGDDSTALVEALRGQQALLVTMSVAAPRDTVSKFIRAAAAAGVPYVLPNWFGQDPTNEELCKDVFLAPMRDGACSEIKELGVSKYLLLACNFWYEFSLGGGPNRYGFDVAKKTLVLFDGGGTRINTTTWPQCGRAVASLLSLKQLPEDENDKSPTLSQFENGPVFVSSFLLSQKDMFESVKRVTKTADADWTIAHESSEARWREAKAGVQKGDWNAFTKMLYSRTWFPNGGGDFQSKKTLANDLLGLPVEDLDEATKEAVRMGVNGEVPFGH